MLFNDPLDYPSYSRHSVPRCQLADQKIDQRGGRTIICLRRVDQWQDEWIAQAAATAVTELLEAALPAKSTGEHTTNISSCDITSAVTVSAGLTATSAGENAARADNRCALQT